MFSRERRTLSPFVPPIQSVARAAAFRLNTELAKKPKHCIGYIVVHEMRLVSTSHLHHAENPPLNLGRLALVRLKLRTEGRNILREGRVYCSGKCGNNLGRIVPKHRLISPNKTEAKARQVKSLTNYFACGSGLGFESPRSYHRVQPCVRRSRPEKQFGFIEKQ